MGKPQNSKVGRQRRLDKPQQRRRLGKPRAQTQVPADPMFTRLIADLRLLKTHEPDDGSDWPPELEPQIFADLMQYLLTLECRQREE